MNKLIRFYNQNRHIVWIVLLSAIAIITFIQILNRFIINENSEEQKVNYQNTINSSKLNVNYSVITGKEVNEKKTNVVDEFIEYCNNGQVEKAYEMLANDCKEILYPNFEEFKNRYYNEIFNTKKQYISQAWTTADNTTTYRVDFIEDMLITGEASKSSISDYYTVKKDDNGNYKLNINKLIEVQTINKKSSLNNITVNILNKIIYMDYEIYNIEVTNDNTEEVMMDKLENTNTIYVIDEKDNKYYWRNYELLETDITVRGQRKQNISIKFNREYNSNFDDEKIVFENIILKNKKTIKISVEL